MIFFVFVLLVLAVPGMKAAGKNEFYPDYMSKEKTTAINGIFTVLVFLSHASTYVKLKATIDTPYFTFRSFLGQAVVAMFLFYSGFGIMESITEKGRDYVRSIPFRRFFKVFYHMVIAVFLYLIVDLIIGKHYSVSKVLLSFIGWDGIGNSNWYIFVTLALYLIVFLSFTVFAKNKYIAVGCTLLLSVGLAYALMYAGKQTWWYNTLILYPLGMLFSLLKEKLQKLVTKNDAVYACFFTAACTIIYILTAKRSEGTVYYCIWVTAFAAAIVLLTMKISFNNNILTWFGTHVFSFYILQRIPMIVFKKAGLASGHGYSYILICFLATVLLSEIFDFAMGKLDRLIYRKKIDK